MKLIVFATFMVLFLSCSSAILSKKGFYAPKWSHHEGIDSEPLILSVKSGSTEPGYKVLFKIWKADSDLASDKPFTVLETTLKDHKAEVQWEYNWEEDSESPLTDYPYFFFSVSDDDGNEIKSNIIRISMNMLVEIHDENDAPQKNVRFLLNGPGKTAVEGKTDETGSCEVNGLIPGNYKITTLNDKK